MATETNNLEFSMLDLKKEVSEGIQAFGFEKPTNFQARVIKPILGGRDVIVQPQPDTETTSTISIASLQITDITENETQVIILTPDREHALQTKNITLRLGRYINVQIHAFYGGVTVADDIIKLERGQHIVLGTPGRVYDMIQRGHLKISNVGALFLDKADEMFQKGFKHDIYNIYRGLELGIQVILFSATLPYQILDMGLKFMIRPVRILDRRNELTLDGIKQYRRTADRDERKFELLSNIFDALTTQVLIFVNTRQKVEWLTDKLVKRQLTVSYLYGSMSENKQEEMVQQFKATKTKVLISTDVLARGVHVQHIYVVINFDIPNTRELYINRVGRSERYGRERVVFNFVTSLDLDVLKDVERFYSKKIEEMPPNIPDLLK